jgi:hypothetical protein
MKLPVVTRLASAAVGNARVTRLYTTRANTSAGSAAPAASMLGGAHLIDQLNPILLREMRQIGQSLVRARSESLQ